MNDPLEPEFNDGLDDADDIEKAKSKLIMDFGLSKDNTPERITIKVLQDLIKEKPEKMTTAVRRWLHPE